MPNVSISLPQLHATQTEAWKRFRRFTVLRCGRRWGKSLIAAVKALVTCLQKPGALVWWVSPTFPLGRFAWRAYIKRLTRPLVAAGVCEMHEADMAIDFINGSRLEMKSADAPDALRSAGLDGVVLDEAAAMRKERWTDELRPALMDRGGWAIFPTTPKGSLNWLTELEGQTASDPAWVCLHYTTADNPFIPASEIEAAQRDMPELVFRQEVLAEIVAGGAGFFRGFERRTHPSPGEHKGHVITLGLDWGRTNDSTVCSVICHTCGKQAAQDVLTKIDYQRQKAHVEAMIDRWKPTRVLAEANAMGQPLIEDLRSKGIGIVGFDMTAQSKPELVQALALAIEQGKLIVLDNPTLVSQLSLFTQAVTPTGHWRYSAPPGAHDDCVIALALSWWAGHKPAPTIRSL